MAPSRLFASAGPFALLLVVAACGSSGSTSVAPSPVGRCEIILNASTTTVPAAGGSGVATVGATRECAWSASVEGGWLSIRSGASGQGEGTVEFTAAANPDPQVRTGALVVNGSKTSITQSAAECVITLATSSADFPQAGGTERIDVRASSALCAWTASADASWISITSGASGRGTGVVAISVAPTTGPPRTGLLTIGGQQFSVTQSQGCAYTLDRTAYTASASGGAGTLAITTAPACPWIATANADWITVAPASGVGPGAVSFSVAATTGAARTGTAVIAGQLFTITQAPGCTFAIAPQTATVPATGSSGSVAVTAPGGCTWTATSGAPWVTINAGSSGVGSGVVQFSVAATTGGARSTTLTIAGQTFTITQGGGCTFGVSPERVEIASAGGAGSVAVMSEDGCAWTSTSGAPWLTITSGAAGSGNGAVAFTATPNVGPARTGTLTIAGRTVTVDQAGTCSYSIAPASATVPATGGTARVELTTAAACAWTATTNVSWITVSAGASGTGSGTIDVSITPNTGSARSGVVTIGGQAFTVNQDGGCAYVVSPLTIAAPTSGTTTRVDVSAAPGCTWTATSEASWITITAGATGTGNGAVDLSIAAHNASNARTGTVLVAGQTVTISQDAACVVTLTPTSQNVPATGGTGSITVEVRGRCEWNAVSNATWIVVTSGGAGDRNGVVQFTVGANDTGGARSGTIVIGGATFTVNQQ